MNESKLIYYTKRFFILFFLCLIVSKSWAPARMHKNTIIYPTGHKYEQKEKYEVCRLKKELRKTSSHKNLQKICEYMP